MPRRMSRPEARDVSINKATRGRAPEPERCANRLISSASVPFDKGDFVQGRGTSSSRNPKRAAGAALWQSPPVARPAQPDLPWDLVGHSTMTFPDIQAAEKAFEREFGMPPRWVARAPGRVNLIGEHTDYNCGFVLPMALECETRIFAAPNGLGKIRLRTTALEGGAEIDLSRAVEPDSKAGWASYPRGVIAGFLQSGHAVPGFDALVHSTVPLGGGLSSS